MNLLVVLLVTALFIAPARAENAPRLTTESIEYCETLFLRLGALPASSGPVPRMLGEEGHRLCQAGHIRTGIAKLRRALRAAHEVASAS